MSINIVDLVKNYVSNELVSKAGSFLGESEGGVSKAVSGLIPTLLGGLMNKATASEAGANEVYETSKAANDGGLLGNLGSLFGNADILSKGTGLFNGLFGGSSNSIIDAIANFAGIKSSSSGSLISMLLPLITGILGKKAADDNIGSSGLASFLGEQKANIQSALPAGLGSIGSLLGLGGSTVSSARETIEELHEPAAPAHSYVEDSSEKSGGGMKWLLPLLLVAALGLLIWFLTKGCNNTDGTVVDGDTVAVTDGADTLSATMPSATASGSYDSTTGNYIYDVGADKEITLADGTKIMVGENSTEAKLFNFLSDAGSAVDADKSKGWITLDRVYFETGKSVLTQESQNQLKNIAAILKNFSTATVKMGGYTDNTGAADLNVKLSGDRAKIAADELVKLGVAAASVASEGYGPEHPICAANDTPECKAQNRRVDIRVTAK